VRSVPIASLWVAALILVIEAGTALASAFGQLAALVGSAMLMLVTVALLRSSERGRTFAIDERSLVRIFVGASLIAFVATPAMLVRMAPHPAAYVVVAVGAVALLTLLVRPPPLPIAAASVVVLGVALRATMIAATRIDALRADMLPVIEQALDDLLSGRSPYHMHQMPSWEVPLSYLPGTFGAYLPARLLRIDLRWTNLVVELGLGLILWRRARSGGDPATIAFLLWAWTFVDPQVVYWSVDSEHPILWTALAVALFAAVDDRRFAAADLGYVLATSPLGIFPLGMSAFSWWRERTLTRALGRGLLAIVVCVAILGPFVAWSPREFGFGVFRWHNDPTLYTGMKWTEGRAWASQLGVAGVFWRYDLVRLLKAVQVLAVALLALRFWLRGARRSELPMTLACTLAVFIVLNSMVWGYLYWPAVVAAFVSLSSQPSAIAESGNDLLQEHLAASPRPRRACASGLQARRGACADGG
jgi:hypothetical protein